MEGVWLVEFDSTSVYKIFWSILDNIVMWRLKYGPLLK
jgi:hypothetical protein